jgi:S-adenosylmethionine-diacylglycerol 3-amino-3-carboxypropyl transferase
MNNFKRYKLLDYWFQARIFISFSIVIFVYALSFIFFGDHKPLYKIISKAVGLTNHDLFFIPAAFSLLLVSALRMWAGSLLSSDTVMSFKIKTNSLIIEGPFQLVRNPIYFADWLAMCTFSLFLPFTGLLLPLLFYLHYRKLIIFEENSFLKEKYKKYPDYLKQVPRLIPSLKSFFGFIAGRQRFLINKDGLRHNALYVLFIPGFIAGYFTGSFIYSIILGLPAVVDWGIIHTKIGLPKSSSRKSKEGKVFNSVLYSQCWEDPDIDRKAFKIKENDVVFSITSGGCNLLTFLIDNPKSVIALDLNPHQNYLLELKIAGFKYLTYTQILEFFGIRKSQKRSGYFGYIKSFLSSEAKEYWEKNIRLIKKGIIHCGRYEHYMKLLRICLYLLIGKSKINQIYLTDDPLGRKKLFEKKWNNLRWKFFTKIFLSRKMMSFLFTKDFFKYLPRGTASFGSHFADKVKRAMTVLPLRENYFLSYILLGNYNEEFLPHYLKKENYDLIRSRVDKVKIITGNCKEFFRSLPPDSISRFNFTNIFEWISEEAFEELLNETIKVAKNNAVITYRNLLVPRQRPKSLSKFIHSDKQLSRDLHNNDLSFIYNNYVVEEIRKPQPVVKSHVLQSY